MITLVAAVAKNRVIGNKGKIPWDLPEDRRHFKELTMGHALVMGRRTFEEIGRPLPGRRTYIVSSTISRQGENCRTVSSLAEALEIEKDSEIFICGGAMLYEEGMAVADRICLTELDWEAEGDVFFPEIDRTAFRETEREYREGGYSFVTYEKNL